MWVWTWAEPGNESFEALPQEKLEAEPLKQRSQAAWERE